MLRKTLIVIMSILTGIAIGLLIVSQDMTTKADEQLAEIDRFIEEHEIRSKHDTSKYSNIAFDDIDNTGISDSNNISNEQAIMELFGNSEQLIEELDNNLTEVNSEIVELEEKNVWQLGYELYGISELDTTRTLKLITYEGYGDSALSYYVACCCWVRATEGYWGYGNLYSAFGEADTSYNEWMDELDIADYAYTYLEQCYRNPTYVKYCNGMTEPYEYVYYEDGIYVW